MVYEKVHDNLLTFFLAPHCLFTCFHLRAGSCPQTIRKNFSKDNKIGRAEHREPHEQALTQSRQPLQSPSLLLIHITTLYLLCVRSRNSDIVFSKYCHIIPSPAVSYKNIIFFLSEITISMYLLTSPPHVPKALILFLHYELPFPAAHTSQLLDVN